MFGQLHHAPQQNRIYHVAPTASTIERGGYEVAVEPRLAKSAEHRETSHPGPHPSAVGWLPIAPSPSYPTSAAEQE